MFTFVDICRPTQLDKHLKKYKSFFLNGSNIEFVEYDKHLGNCFGMHSKEALIDQAINVFKFQL